MSNIDYVLRYKHVRYIYIYIHHRSPNPLLLDFLIWIIHVGISSESEYYIRSVTKRGIINNVPTYGLRRTNTLVCPYLYL